MTENAEFLCVFFNDRINGDAFRPPSKGMLLSILVGNGVQIAMTLLITLGRQFRLFLIFLILFI
jgi:hypothetical protein